ncbi:MAG: site-2 protease family protein [Anaerolineae bacterium]
MKLKSISLGRVLGIPIALDFSWFLIFFLLTWTLAANVFPAEFPGWPVAQYWVVGAITAILLFASVLLHELGHSVVAIHYKIPVKRITLFIFGGVAQIGSEPPSANAEFWIAIAGPLVSFGLAAVFRLLQQVVGGLAPLLALATYLAYINATLALFNLIPGFPLDGGRVLRAILWGAGKDLSQATVIAANAGRLIAFLFMGFGLWQALVGNLANGLWIAFIGWFLHGAATSQLMLSGTGVASLLSRPMILRRSRPIC